MLDKLSVRVEMPLAVDPNDEFASFAGAYRFESAYGLALDGANAPSISHHLSVSTLDTEPHAFLHSIVRGRIRFIAATATTSASIELQPLPFELIVLGQYLSGSVLPAVFVYSNVDTVAVETAVDGILAGASLSDAERARQRNEFLAGNRWLTVAAGTRIGKPAVDPTLGGRRRLDLSAQDSRGFFLNPAHYLFQWYRLRAGLAQHPLIVEIASHQHPHMLPSKSRILLVRHDAPNPASPYANADTAARQINDAIVEAVPGDVVCVVDNATYAEKIFMPPGVTLTSAARIGMPGRPAETDPALPTLSDPGSLSPAVVFENLDGPPTHLSGFRITSGQGEYGSGILVRDAVNVEIAQNEVFTNLAVRGGGIGIVDSRRVVVSRCRIRDNRADDSQVGDKGQGGGVYVGGQSADVHIDDNHIYRNQATNFGGGACVDFPARRVRLQRNRIGGITNTEGNQVTLDRLPYLESVVLDNPQGGGGGVGIYNTDVVLVENEIWHNEAHCGGGIEFYVRAHGLLERNDIAHNRTRPAAAYTDVALGGDGGGIAVNNTSLDAANADYHRAIILINNRIRNNQAEDDGGGIYGTAKALIDISGQDTEISGNQARNNGGGVRVSFGSQLRIRNGVIRSNNANIGGGNGGGGGIAARNSKVVLEDCLIEANQVNGFGGGGIYVVTLEEGSPVTGLSTFDDILQGYRFTFLELTINRATIVNNTATGARGAGAGLYGVYDEYDMHVVVNDTALHGNIANHADSDKRKNLVFQDNSTVPIGGIENDDDLTSLNPLNGYDKLFSP